MWGGALARLLSLRKVASIASKASGLISKYGSWIWRSIDIASVGYIAYDLFSGSKGDSPMSEDPAIHPLITSCIVKKDMIRNFDQVALAYQRAGAVLANSDGRAESELGVSLLVFSDYISSYLSRRDTFCGDIQEMKKRMKVLMKLEAIDENGKISYTDQDGNIATMSLSALEEKIEAEFENEQFNTILEDSDAFVLYDAIIFIKTRVSEEATSSN
jgi:hypothetical protein